MKRKFLLILTIFFVAVNNFNCVYANDINNEINIYVSPDGDDLNTGLQDNPVKTIQAAQNIVRKYNNDMKSDIIVNIMPGTYNLDKMLEFTTADSGSNGHNVIYRGKDLPVISGGRKVLNFKKSEKYPNLIEAELPNVDDVEEFYVDGDKKYVAKSERLFTPSNYKDSNSEYASDGLYVSKDYVQRFNNLEDVEFIWNRCWVKTLLHPVDIIEDETNRNRMIVKFNNPKWNSIYVTGNSSYATSTVSCFVQNALELLDKPGEFYFDKNIKKLYYMPQQGESIENSVFTIPELDTAMFIMGSSVDDKVHNIVFDGIKFTQFTIDTEFTDFASTGQGPTYRNNWNGRTIENNFGTIYVNRASDIQFLNNHFTGLGQAAINIKDAVSNCKIEGNCFYDLTGSGVEIGSQFHIEYKYFDDDPNSKDEKFNVKYYVEDNPKTDFNMMLLQPYIYSSNPAQRFEISNKSGYNEYSLQPHNSAYTTSVEDFTNYKLYGNDQTWISKSENGSYPYVMYDFVKEYSFSEIALAFKEDVTDSQKSQYEVLLSNDKHFKDFARVAVQNDAPGEVADYKITDKNKYRYMMIRKTVPEDFAITSVYAFTPDLPNQIVRQMCENIEVSNNYFTRCADVEYSAIPIFAYACENLKVLNNEICNLPYTGISYGLNWGSYGMCGKGVIKNNYIHDVCTINGDGGGIYTLGNHNGSEISGNYIYNTGIGHGIYLDNGTYGIDVKNNVVELSMDTLNVNTGALDNKADSTYSPKYVFTTWATADAIDITNSVEYIIGSEPEAVTSIKNNSGLEKEFSSIKDKVENRACTTSVYMGASSNCSVAQGHKNDQIEELGYVISKIKANIPIGNANVNLIKDLLNKSDDIGRTSAKDISELTDVVKEIAELCKSPSLDSRISEYTDLINSVQPVDNIQVAANVQCVERKYYDKFKKLLDEQKTNKDFNNYSELDKAYSEFVQNMLLPELYNASVDGEKCNVNQQNKTITVYTSQDSIKSDKLALSLAPNTEVVSSIPLLELNKKVQIALCAKGSKKYAFWQVEVLPDSDRDPKTQLDNSLFKFDDELYGGIERGYDNTVTILPFGADYCAYYDGKINVSDNTSVKFAVNKTNWNNKVNFVIGAQKLTGFTPTAASSEYDRIEIEFYNKIMRAYLVTGGKKTLLSDRICEVEYNTVNTLSYRLENTSDSTAAFFNINGNEYKFYIPKIISGETFGFYSYNNSVTLY